MKPFHCTVTVLVWVLTCVIAPVVFGQGNLAPPGPPSPTMKSLDQVEARTIVNVANTPGDATNTFIINQPGSYYLTGNITGESGKHGISVQTNNVTLDLNGFALISGGGGASRGINVPVAQTNLSIRNGKIQGWTGGGVRAETSVTSAERLMLDANVGATGLAVGNGSIIRDCVASGNGVGFFCPDRTQISNSIATVNTGTGFNCTSYVTIVDCTSSRNAGIGIVVQTSSTVMRCTAGRNDLGGIVAGAGSTVADCTAGSNGAAGVGSGISVDEGSAVRNCAARANAASGIAATNACDLRGNTCDLNVTGISVTGPGNGGSANTIDGNACSRNQVGVSVFGLFNIVVRNTAKGNSSQGYSISAPMFNQIGPIVTAGETITSTSPWANFE